MRHYDILKKTTRYLKGTREFGIVYNRSTRRDNPKIRIYAPPNHHGDPEQRKLEIASDADFASDELDRKSITGAVITLNHSQIASFYRKKKAVAMSTDDAEYRAMAMALQLARLLHRIITSITLYRATLPT